MSVGDLLAKADRRLTAAVRDLEAGDVERSLSASYYSMFYAAAAALEKIGISRAKHSAVIAAFGEQFAKTKRVDARYHSIPLDAPRSVRLALRGRLRDTRQPLPGDCRGDLERRQVFRGRLPLVAFLI